MNKHLLKGLLQRTGELMYFSKELPKPRFQKIITEMKMKISQSQNSPQKFHEDFGKFVDFKKNYIQLAYPKAEVSEDESKLC